MAHKKSLLTKYLSGNESSDCRSPRHDGTNWFIPETSLSGPLEPENRNPAAVITTSSTSNRNEESRSTSRGENIPEDDQQDQSNRADTTPSTGEKFPEDTSKCSKSTSDATTPYLGTEVHPIDGLDSSSAHSDGHSNGHSTQVITGDTTQIITVTDSSSSTTTEEEFTLGPVTSTPLRKKQPPPLKYTAIEDGNGDSSNLPSTIFGSPETSSHKFTGDGGESSSDISESELDNILDQNLKTMVSSLETSKKINRTRKRDFFESMLKGKDHLHYLLHYVT